MHSPFCATLPILGVDVMIAVVPKLGQHGGFTMFHLLDRAHGVRHLPSHEDLAFDGCLWSEAHLPCKFVYSSTCHMFHIEDVVV